jgi:hypothetical protein
LPLDEAATKCHVRLTVPDALERFFEDIPEAHLGYCMASAAKDPFKRGRDGWVEIHARRDVPVNRNGHFFCTVHQEGKLGEIVSKDKKNEVQFRFSEFFSSLDFLKSLDRSQYAA